MKERAANPSWRMFAAIKRFALQILDTNAQERLRYSAYLGADLVIVLYSVTDLDSFNNVEKKVSKLWIYN